MSRQESAFPKSPQPVSWNVVRSKSIPSGVSGAHPVARPTISAATDESIFNRDVDVPPVRRRTLNEFKKSGHTELKH